VLQFFGIPPILPAAFFVPCPLFLPRDMNHLLLSVCGFGLSANTALVSFNFFDSYGSYTKNAFFYALYLIADSCFVKVALRGWYYPHPQSRVSAQAQA